MVPALHPAGHRDRPCYRMGWRVTQPRAGNGAVLLLILIMLAVFVGIGLEMGALFQTLGGLLS